jgi:hypothetical protein
MRTLLNQIEQSLNSGFYYLSLMTALSIPDIAGALDSANGEASGQKYADWFEKHVRPRFIENVRKSLPQEIADRIPAIENPLTGEACYRFRCSLLHQGSSQHPRSPFSRIIFIEPGATTNVIHYGTMSGALCIDLRLFCHEVIAGARLWLDTVEGSEPFNSNYGKFARRHPNGLPPYISGVPVVG